MLSDPLRDNRKHMMIWQAYLMEFVINLYYLTRTPVRPLTALTCSLNICQIHGAINRHTPKSGFFNIIKRFKLRQTTQESSWAR